MRIVLISTNAGLTMGGEAIKALQYFEYLAEQGVDVMLVTHERNKVDLCDHPFSANIFWVADDFVQSVCWHSVLFRSLLDVIFHLKCRAILASLVPPDLDVVFHYICPISPAKPRFPLGGHRVVYGPMNGNLWPPKGFLSRVSVKKRISLMLHLAAQWFLGFAVREKKRVDWFLNSGGKRTVKSLILAGARKSRIVEVFDAGVHLSNTVRPGNDRKQTEFVCLARLVRYKGVDLAIKAISRLPSDFRLTVIGDGEELRNLKALTDVLEITDRVKFSGHQDRQSVQKSLIDARALVFPSFAEANGIAVQEAMWLGTPVIALDHGGPQTLLAENRGVLVSPTLEDQIVTDIAQAMSNLAESDEEVARISAASMAFARKEFAWEAVAATWMRVYSRSI